MLEVGDLDRGLVTARRRPVDLDAQIERVLDGLDPRVRAILFEPFVQGDDRGAAAHPGIGVGLTLARGFVELHVGSIRAVERPSGGVLVAIELPAEPA